MVIVQRTQFLLLTAAGFFLSLIPSRGIALFGVGLFSLSGILWSYERIENGDTILRKVIGALMIIALTGYIYMRFAFVK